MKSMNISSGGEKSRSPTHDDEEKKSLIDVESQTPKPKAKPTSDVKAKVLKFLWCFFGLQISYVTWGVMQELIMDSQFHPTKSVPSGKFPSASFCVFSNRFLAIIVSYCVCQYVHGTVYCSAPATAFLPCALSNTLSSWGQYASLQYVSFPLQNLFKSAKVIPVMLMGIVLRGVKYKLVEYAEAVFITIGVIIFSQSKTSSNSGETSPIGILLLFLYITCDSFTAQWQSRIYKEHGKIDQYHMMFWVNTWAVMMTAVSLLYNLEILVVVEFLTANPRALVFNIITAITSASGQFFIFYTIKEFGPVVFTVIMTTRQMLSMVVSSVFFGHPMSMLSYIGAVCVFGAVLHSIRRQMQKSSGNEG